MERLIGKVKSKLLVYEKCINALWVKQIMQVIHIFTKYCLFVVQIRSLADNKVIIKDPTTPWMCRYFTVWSTTNVFAPAWKFIWLRKCQNPLHQFPRRPSFPVQQIRNKFVTSCRGKSPLCLLCHFRNSTTTTCCQLVTDLLATRQTILTCHGSFPCCSP